MKFVLQFQIKDKLKIISLPK